MIAAIFITMLVPKAEAAVPANGRAWELMTVNPPSSSRVVGIRPIRDDGERIIYAAAGPPGNSPSGSGVTYGGALRGPSGWIDLPMGAPYEGEFPGEFPVALVAPLLATGVADDEETILWVASVPLTPDGPPEDELALYRQLPGGAVQLIAKVGTGNTLFNYFEEFADISRDGGRAVFNTKEHLLPADAARTEGKSIYVWEEGELELVDVDSGGAPISACGSLISRANGASVSMERVFFAASPACGEPKRVYLRDIEAGTTTEISASLCNRVDCNPPSDVIFAAATPDGDFAYLTTNQQLVNADEDLNRDLYRYNVGTGGLSLLSGSASVTSGEVVNAVVYPSDSGERVYFRATGEILPGETELGEKLLMADGGGLHVVAHASLAPPTEISLTPDGGRALFVTQTPVLEGDTDEKQGDAYLYDAGAGSLTRISAGPVGGNGEHSVRIEPVDPVNRQEFEYGNRPLYYAIDATGQRAFFQTAESLVPEDTNGVADVYEWWNGTLGLVTPGYQRLGSDFAGASRDGRSVVFGTNASLVGRDADGESRDLYVARIGGGFPEPSQPVPGCDNISCPLPLGERISRSVPPSLGPPPRRRGALRVISVATKARNGAIGVVVSLPAPGVVSGQIATRQKGKRVVLAEGKTRARRAGRVQLELKLTSSARRASGGGAKEAQLTVSQGSSKVSRTVKVSVP